MDSRRPSGLYMIDISNAGSSESVGSIDSPCTAYGAAALG